MMKKFKLKIKEKEDKEDKYLIDYNRRAKRLLTVSNINSVPSPTSSKKNLYNLGFDLVKIRKFTQHLQLKNFKNLFWIKNNVILLLFFQLFTNTFGEYKIISNQKKKNPQIQKSN